MKSFQVHFVDYGNTETLKLKDISKLIMYGDKPIISTKYCLNNIQSTNPDHQWTSDAVGMALALTTNQKCQIFTHERISDSPNAPIPCTIRCMNAMNPPDLDVATILISHGYAVKMMRTTKKTTSNEQDVHLLKRTRNQSNESFKIDLSKIKTIDDLKSVYVKHKISVPPQHSDQNDKKYDQNIIDDLSYSFGHEVRELSHSTMLDDDKQISDKLPIILKYFKLMNIDLGYREFICSKMIIIDPVTILVRPGYARTIEHQFEDDYNVLGSDNFSIRLYSPCLAFCSKTQTFERGIVNNDKMLKSLITILFVDSMTIENVKKSSVYECPKSLLSVPLPFLLVNLYGIEPKENISISRLCNQLDDELSKTGDYEAKLKRNHDKLQIKLYRCIEKERISVISALVRQECYIKTTTKQSCQISSQG